MLTHHSLLVQTSDGLKARWELEAGSWKLGLGRVQRHGAPTPLILVGRTETTNPARSQHHGQESEQLAFLLRCSSNSCGAQGQHVDTLSFGSLSPPPSVLNFISSSGTGG